MRFIKITDHAVDRASLRLMNLWVQDAQCNEGLNTWLIRKANEALDKNIKNTKGFYLIEGMKFMIRRRSKKYFALITVLKEDE